MRNSLTILFALLLSVCISASVHAQEESVASEKNVEEIFKLISGLKEGNAELNELLKYQNDFRALLEEYPSEALAARLPYSTCLDSVLAPYCQAFEVLFLKEE